MITLLTLRKKILFKSYNNLINRLMISLFHLIQENRIYGKYNNDDIILINKTLIL